MCSRPKIKTSKLSCVLKAGAVRRQHGWRLLGGDESDVSAFTDQLKTDECLWNVPEWIH